MALRLNRSDHSNWLPSPRGLGVVALIGILALIQACVFPFFPILGTNPSLVLMLVIAIATIDNRSLSLVWGFIGGFIVDIFSSAPLGTSAFLFTLLVHLAGSWGQRFERVTVVFAVLAGAVATMLYYPMFALAMQLHGLNFDWILLARDQLPHALAVNTGAILVLYPVARIATKLGRTNSSPRFQVVQ